MIFSRSRVPKRVLFLGCMLGLSFALLGGLGTYLARNLNAEYAQIVTNQLPSLGLVRDVSKANSTGRRLLETAGNRLSAEELEVLKARIEKIRDENTARLARLDTLLDSPESMRLSQRLREDRRVYHELADAFLARLSQGVDAEERMEWRTRIAEMDTKYVEAQDRLADYCELSATVRGDELSRSSRLLMWFFTVIAVWPLVLATAVFLWGFASTLILFARGRENL
jgi:hypothetical protein